MTSPDPSTLARLRLPVRLPIAALALSAAGYVGIVGHEGYTDGAVRPLPTDVPTYGFGSTTGPDGKPVQMGDRITPPAALRLSLREIRGAEGLLKGCLSAPLTQGEYDSLVSLAYNVGPGAVCKSTMVSLHNAGRHEEACAQFDRWTFFQGRDCKDPLNRCTGLAKRRAAERAQCEGKA